MEFETISVNEILLTIITLVVLPFVRFLQTEIREITAEVKAWLAAKTKVELEKLGTVSDSPEKGSSP